MPTNLTGIPVTDRMERAAPPRASPSILVRIRPVSGVRAWKAWATLTASWPVVASATKRVSTGFDGAADLFDLVHHPVVQLDPAGGVDDDVGVGVADAEFEAAPGDVNGTGPGALLVHGHVDLLAQGLQLGDGGRAVGVGGHQQGPSAVLAKRQRQLGRGGGLARALEPDHENDRRGTLRRGQADRLAAEQFHQVVVDDLGDLLGGGDALGDLAANGALAHRGGRTGGRRGS